jgi:transcriptional regulator with XRE-family HTH domain
LYNFIGGKVQLPERIKEIRKASKMSQEKFAKFLGLDRSHISKLETGAAAPSAALIKLICKFFSINEEWLKSGQGKKFIGDYDILQQEALDEFEFNINEERYDNLNLHLWGLNRTFSNSVETFRSLEIHLAANDFSIDMKHPKTKAMESTTRKIKDNMEKLIKILDKIFDNNPNKI